MYLANASIVRARERTAECNGRRLLVSRFARVLPATRERRSITENRRAPSSSVQFGVIATRDGASRRGRSFPRSWRSEPQRLLFLTAPFSHRDLHRSRIARSIADSHPPRSPRGEDPFDSLRSISQQHVVYFFLMPFLIALYLVVKFLRFTL